VFLAERTIGLWIVSKVGDFVGGPFDEAMEVESVLAYGQAHIVLL